MLMFEQELYDGFYDGVTGLVTQPRYGYKQKGTKGMVKGVGKGLGGVFFKPPAGMTENKPKLKVLLVLTAFIRTLGTRRLPT